MADDIADLKTVLRHLGITFSGEGNSSFSEIYATVTWEGLASGSWKEKAPGLQAEHPGCEAPAL